MESILTELIIKKGIDMPLTYEEQVAQYPEPGEWDKHTLTPEGLIDWGAEVKNTSQRERTGQLYSSTSIPTASPAQALRAQLNEAYAIEDPVDRHGAFLQVMGSRDALVAKAKVGAFQQAEAEFHLPELQKMYQESLDLDKADPLWQKYRAPSTITNKLQDQIIQASAAAKGQAEKYYLGNSDIQEITKSLDPEFKRFDAINAQKDKDIAKQAAKEEALSLFGSESRQLAQWITPGLKPEALDATTINYMKNRQFQEVVQTADPAQLLPLAIIGQNRIAATALVERQARAATGGKGEGVDYDAARSKAVKDFGFINSFATNPVIRAEVLLSKFPPTPDGKPNVELTKLLASSGIDLTDKSAEAQKGRAQAWLELGNRMLAKDNQEKFEGDVLSWPANAAFKDPAHPLGKLYSITQERLGTGTPIGVQSLSANIKKLPEAERAFAQAELIKAANQSVSKFSGAYIGKFSDSFNAEAMVYNYVAGGILNWGKLLGNLAATTAAGAAAGGITGALIPTPLLPVTTAGGALVGGAVGLAQGGFDLGTALAEEFK